MIIGDLSQIVNMVVGWFGQMRGVIGI